MRFDSTQVLVNIRDAATDDLLDRATVYRAGLEPEALELVELELRRRDVSAEQIAAHASHLEKCLRDATGIALSCSCCRKPAVAMAWGWHRLWGKIPVFPRRNRYCADHLRNAMLVAMPTIILAMMATGQTSTYPNHHDLSFYLDEAGQKQSIKSAADWARRRRHILANLQMVMGELPGDKQRAPLDVKMLEDIKVGNLVRRKLTFQSEPGHRVPAYLFLPPAAKDQKTAAILCLHQTTALGKGEPSGMGGNPNLHYALHLAQRGFITLVPDYPSFGEHKWDFAAHPHYASGTMKAIWDNIRAVDLLQTMPEVDPERLGVMGHSLGGHNAMFTAAFEPRLKVIVSSCGFTSFQKDDMPSWTGKVYMPRIAKVYGNDANKVPFDFPEIVGAFAPRPFLACAATKDDDFEVSGVKDCLAAARPIYGLFKAEANLVGYYPESKHDFPADARKVAYEFLERHLKK